MARLTILTYDYVDDVLERRKPHREAHLAHVRRWSEERSLVLAGATGDPPTGALFVFEGEEAEVDEFAAADPYREGGVITAHRVQPWTIVAHREFDLPPG